MQGEIVRDMKRTLNTDRMYQEDEKGKPGDSEESTSVRCERKRKTNKARDEKERKLLGLQTGRNGKVSGARDIDRRHPGTEVRLLHAESTRARKYSI